MNTIRDLHNVLYAGPFMYKGDMLFFNENGIYVLTSPTTEAFNSIVYYM